MDKIKKIFSPGHGKDDDVMYGSGEDRTGHHTSGTGSSSTTEQLHSSPAAEKDSGMMRQILNPGNNKYDETRYGTTATTNPTSATGEHLSSRPAAVGNPSTESIRSGIVGAEQSQPSKHLQSPLSADTQTADYSSGGTGVGNTTSLPDRTATGSGSTNFSHPSGERSFPLGGGSNTSGNTGYDSSASGTHDSRLGRDSALTGGAGATGLGASTAGGNLVGHDHEQFGGDPCPPGQEVPAPGYPHHVSGPHSTDIANLLDPHVPGGFPTEGGEGLRGGNHTGRDAAVAGGAGATGLGALEQKLHHHNDQPSTSSGLSSQSNTGAYSGSSQPTTGAYSGSSQPSTGAYSGSSTTGMEQPREHHYGRDAALAGGAGAAGLGAVEAGRHHNQHDAPLGTTPGYDDQRFDPTATHSGSHGLRSGEQPSSIGYPTSTSHPSVISASSEQPRDDHHGRNAALGTGAGLAAVGGYEASKDRHSGSTGIDPTLKTTGSVRPHQSDSLNMADPRISSFVHHHGRDAAAPVVAADARGTHAASGDEHLHGHDTSHESNTLNRADPRTNASGSTEREHHYGRDAAVAGGAGAGLAAIGGHEASRDRHSGSTGIDPSSTRRSETLDNTVDPRVSSHEHHYGRDAAVGGGAGAGLAALGGHEASRDRHSGSTGIDQSSTHRRESLDNMSDPRVSSHMHHRDDDVAGGAGAGHATAYGLYPQGVPHGTSGAHQSDALNRADPRVSSHEQHRGRDADADPRDSSHGHHLGRDAAVAGGAGTAGLAAKEHHHGRDDDVSGGAGAGHATAYGLYPQGVPHGTQQSHPTYSSLNEAREHHYGRDEQLASGARAAGLPQGTQQSHLTHSSLNEAREHHYGRDAAIAGGAGAAGLGAHEYGKDRHDPSTLGPGQTQQRYATPTGAPSDQRIFDQTQNVPDHKQAPAGWAADSTAQDKLAHEESKMHQKEEKHAQKEHEKELKHAQKEHEKEVKHAEKHHEKEEKEEKKGGLFGFLHHKSKDTTPDEKEAEHQGNLREADQAAHLRHQRELEGDASRGSISAAGARFEPSLGEQQQYSDRSSSTGHGVGVATDERGHNRLHKDPPAKVQRELEERARDQQGDESFIGSGQSNTNAPGYYNDRTQGTSGLGQSSTNAPGYYNDDRSTAGIGSGQDRFETDPTTGLKMNVGKYGSGTGGTDGGPIPGYRQ